MSITNKNKPIRVLITDGAYKHTLGAVRSLAQAGFEVDAIGSRRCLTGWSRHLAKVAYHQDLFNNGTLNKFVSFLANSNYDVLLPIGARSVQLVSRHRAIIEEHCSIPLPSAKTIELCLDKEETTRFAATLGVKVPQTWAFTCLHQLEVHIAEIAFPVVVKGKSEIVKNRPLYANDADQLLKKINVWGKGLSSEGMPFPIIQQFIDGIGVGFFALYEYGKCKRVFMHRRLRETPPSGGASSCAVSIYQADLLQVGKKILDALEWHGVAMVEFKRERSTSDLYLMEINPKYWGSLDLALASGVDFPVLDVRMAMGEQIPYSDQYRIGLKFHWPLDGEINHIKENPKALFPVLVDCIDPRVKSNLSASDPLPAFYSLYIEMWTLVYWILAKFGLGRIMYRIHNQGFRTAFVRTYSEGMGIPIVKYSRITPQIYIGAQHSLAGKRKLNRMGINGIVNMRSEFDDNQHDLVLGDYCYLPTVEFTAPEIEQLQKGVAFIKRVVEKDGKVYIHCSEGISRAPTLAAAYFISQGMSHPDAVASIKESRPFINILPVQMTRLSEFADMYGNDKAQKL
ncbi:MAG: ATP-grasp domain-containing protein [Desulfobacterales bacterium]|nr:ATP-grasp domain-containing protein [Desulfobacterales bacterium]